MNTLNIKQEWVILNVRQPPQPTEDVEYKKNLAP